MKPNAGGQPVPQCAPGPEELLHRRITGHRRWYAGAGIALSFLVIAMVQEAASGRSPAFIVTFEVFAVIFGLAYLLAPIRVAGAYSPASPTWVAKARALAVVAGLVALTVPMIVIGGTGVTGLWIYIGAAAAMMLRTPWALAVALVLAAAMLLLSGFTDGALAWEVALILVTLTLLMSGFASNIRLNIELRATREELARTAVVAERERIGRDLHDILGHSLTAIAVKAGLARRLVATDVDAATAEVSDVEQLAREALADVRATAAGYRNVSLAGELAVARSVLTAAGIQSDLPTAVADVIPAGRGVFGYVVREGVTNIVRHSGARSCSIELTRTMLRITDDGSGDEAKRSSARQVQHGIGAEDGTGLRGLADRVAAVGGSFEATTLPGGGFRLTATVVEPGSAENGVIPRGSAS